MFKIADVAARMQKIEAAMWREYTALATLALIRGTKRRDLERKVFATDKPSATFRQAFNIAAKLFANGMGAERKDAIAEMGIEEACKAVMDTLAAHMTALGVSGKNAYLERADYVGLEEWNKAQALAKEDADAEPQPDAEPDAEPDAPNTAIDAPASPVAVMLEQAKGLSIEELLELAAGLNALMADRAETEAARPENRPLGATAGTPIVVKSFADLAKAA